MKLNEQIKIMGKLASELKCVIDCEIYIDIDCNIVQKEEGIACLKLSVRGEDDNCNE